MRRRLSQAATLRARRSSASTCFSAPPSERSEKVPKRDELHDDPPSEDPPTDEHVLAAIERAARHRARDTHAVPIWAIAEHLGLPRRSARARGIRAQLDRMTSDGQLQCARLRGVMTWTLTSAGHKRLAAERLAGHARSLPESPQHLAWRRARTAASCEIERFRRSLTDDLDEALRLLDAEPSASSDAWLELGERLHRDMRRLASASHCLYEWREPHDEVADVDDRREPGDERLDPAERARARARRVGRRNVHLWEDGPGAGG
jgi:hypothetical protein